MTTPAPAAVRLREQQVFWANVLAVLLVISALATAVLRLWSALLLHRFPAGWPDPYDAVQVAWRMAAPVTIALHLAWTQGRRPLTQPFGSTTPPVRFAVRKAMPWWIRWTPEWLAGIGLAVFQTGGFGLTDAVSPLPASRTEAIYGSVLWALAFLLVPVRVAIVSRPQPPPLVTLVPGTPTTSVPSPLGAATQPSAHLPHDEPSFTDAAVVAGELFGSLLVVTLAVITIMAMGAAYAGGAQPLSTTVLVVAISAVVGAGAYLAFRRTTARTRSSVP